MSRSWAAVAYLPVPGWQVVPVLAAPTSRLTRYHAWQAGAQSVLLWSGLVLLGLVARLLPGAATVVGLVAGVWALVLLFGLLAGGAAAAQGRFTRAFPAAAVLAAMGR